MCKVEESSSELMRERRVGRERMWEMGLRLKTILGDSSKVDKLRASMANRSSRIKLWMLRAMTTVLLWTCFVQLTAMGDIWRPRLLKGWPSCFNNNNNNHPWDSVMAAQLSVAPKIPRPPKSKFSLLGHIPFFFFFFFLLWLRWFGGRAFMGNKTRL